MLSSWQIRSGTPRTQSGRKAIRSCVLVPLAESALRMCRVHLDPRGSLSDSLSEQPHLPIMGYWERSDDDPGVRRDLMPLLGRAHEEVKVGLKKAIEVLLADLGQGDLLVFFSGAQAVPVERSGLPIEPPTTRRPSAVRVQLCSSSTRSPRSTSLRRSAYEVNEKAPNL